MCDCAIVCELSCNLFSLVCLWCRFLQVLGASSYTSTNATKLWTNLWAQNQFSHSHCQLMLTLLAAHCWWYRSYDVDLIYCIHIRHSVELAAHTLTVLWAFSSNGMCRSDCRGIADWRSRAQNFFFGKVLYHLCIREWKTNLQYSPVICTLQ